MNPSILTLSTPGPVRILTDIKNNRGTAMKEDNIYLHKKMAH
jgi:hypothetical protein